MAVTAPGGSPADTDLVGRIAALLVDGAILVGDQATWLTPQLAEADPAALGEEETAPTIGRTGASCLYDGSAGIGWALAVVGAGRGDGQLQEVAAAGVRHALARAEVEGRDGLYDGAAGVGLAAIAVGGLLGVDELRTGGVGLLRRAGASTPSSDDLIDGSAGIALACLRGARLADDGALLAAAQRQVETLVARAERHTWGWCWPSQGEAGLCGLAHGAGGAAWALGEVAAATATSAPSATATSPSLSAAREAARRYERSWFDPRSNTWPDLRQEVAAGDGSPPRPSLWCHGGVGIGLSRLAVHRVDPHPALVGEAVAARTAASEEAAHQVAAGVLPSGLTFCHGLGGTLALLVATADRLDAPEDLHTARQLLAGALDHLGAHPAAWPGGLLQEPGPGLMTGLAGTMLVLEGMEDPAALAPLIGLGA